jgi:hypothetical protein
MSELERKSFSSCLFDRSDIEVLDIKFLRGRDPNLTPDELCATAEKVLGQFFANRQPSQLPVGRRPQRTIAEILANH